MAVEKKMKKFENFKYQDIQKIKNLKHHQILLSYADTGNQSEVTRRLFVPRQTVQRVIKVFEDPESLNCNSICRPKAISVRKGRRLALEIKKKHNKFKGIKNDLKLN